MVKLKVKDFTNEELVNLFIDFLKRKRKKLHSSNAPMKTTYDWIEELEDGSWLKYYEDRINNEYNK